MILVRPDAARRVAIDGVTAPVHRPVDIDEALTGFSVLRTLRIYRFDAGSSIDGHAEEDEVIMVLLSGSAHLTLRSDCSAPGGEAVAVAGADRSGGGACAAYLPPRGAYRISVDEESEVAYARATPVGQCASPRLFEVPAASAGSGTQVLLDTGAYGKRLRMRMIRAHARQKGLVVPEIDAVGQGEAFLHLRSHPRQGTTFSSGVGGENEFAIADGETIVYQGGRGARLVLSPEASALALALQAT